jgi:hypothetical protein
MGNDSKQDSFYCLDRPTIAKTKEILLWAHKRAMKTEVDSSDSARMIRRTHSDKPFEEVVRHVDRKAREYFRVILRRDRNWFMILTNDLHIEDMVEVGIRGVEIDGEEYFTFSYLKKEMLDRLKKKFPLKEICATRKNS